MGSLKREGKYILSVFLREVNTRLTLRNAIPNEVNEGVINPKQSLEAKLNNGVREQ